MNNNKISDDDNSAMWMEFVIELHAVISKHRGRLGDYKVAEFLYGLGADGMELFKNDKDE